jgi:hypothetical protein
MWMNTAELRGVGGEEKFRRRQPAAAAAGGGDGRLFVCSSDSFVFLAFIFNSLFHSLLSPHHPPMFRTVVGGGWPTSLHPFFSF